MNFTSQKGTDDSNEEKCPGTHARGFSGSAQWCLGLDHPLLWGTVPCIIRCLVTSLASTYRMLVTLALIGCVN